MDGVLAQICRRSSGSPNPPYGLFSSSRTQNRNRRTQPRAEPPLWELSGYFVGEKGGAEGLRVWGKGPNAPEVNSDTKVWGFLGVCSLA